MSMMIRVYVIAISILFVISGCQKHPEIASSIKKQGPTVIEKYGLHEFRAPSTLEVMSVDSIVAEFRAREAIASKDDSLAVFKNPMLRNVSNEALASLYDKAIYGQFGADDRKDLFELDQTNVSHGEMLRLADSVVAIMSTNSIRQNGDGAVDDPLSGTATLEGSTFGRKYGLCKEERFREQLSLSFCSGTLIAPDLVLTAGHCFDKKISHSPVKDIRVVFGYRLDATTKLVPKIPNKDIYSVREIVGISSMRGADWAIIRLDRAVKNRTPLKVARFEKSANEIPISKSGIPLGKDVFTIGHPCGLPVKVADNSQVWANSNQRVFVANLDTYGGNSGSPVFAKHDGQTKVVGVLVRGLEDFDFFSIDGTSICNKSLRYRDNQAGEVCTRTSEFIAVIDELNK